MTPDAQPRLWKASFPCLRLKGSGARQFLHGQTSAAIQQAPEHRLIRSCWLTATGRVQALLEVRLDPEGAEVLVLCGNAEALATGFERVIFPADRVKITGLAPQLRLQRLVPAPHPLKWAETVLWSRNGSRPDDWDALPMASPEQVERWRISQGLPLSANELNGETNPLELGLGEWLSLEKGCYLGQETVAKLASRDGVKQQLRCWTLHQSSPTAAAPTPGTLLLRDGDRAGVITSAVLHDNSWQGLALIRRSAFTQTSLELSQGQQPISLHLPPSFQDCSSN